MMTMRMLLLLDGTRGARQCKVTKIYGRGWRQREKCVISCMTLTTKMNIDDNTRFKCLLEYFVAHLEWVTNQDENGPGYERYIKPLLDADFRIQGTGWDGGRIQKQVQDWCHYDDWEICITIRNQPQLGYRSRGCYLNWMGEWYNVRAEWDEPGEHVDALYITEEEGTDAPVTETATLSELGLFDGKEPGARLRRFFKHYKLLTMADTPTQRRCLSMLEANKNIILTGAPGTGKTHTAQAVAQALGADRESVEFVQFHPSYDYTDFVEGLRPVSDAEGHVGFERRDGAFMAFCRRAVKDKERPYVFIIDEINRGELSKIFGELFFSIDPGYRGEKGATRTQYSNLRQEDTDFGNAGSFYVPENVYVIGTMNDIDRSVETMDFAMRRRFTFIPVTADESKVILDALKDRLPEGMKMEELKAKMEALNGAIAAEESLGEAFQLGGAYFLKAAECLDYEELWEDYLENIVREYLRGLPEAPERLETLKKAYTDAH